MYLEQLSQLELGDETLGVRVGHMRTASPMSVWLVYKVVGQKGWDRIRNI